MATYLDYGMSLPKNTGLGLAATPTAAELASYGTNASYSLGSGTSGLGLQAPSGLADWSNYGLANKNYAGPGLDTNSGFNFSPGSISTGLAGLQTVGNIWNAYQSQKLAKAQFAFSKDMANTNLTNQIQSYNTALSDRARSRGVAEGQSSDQVQSYVDKNKMTR